MTDAPNAATQTTLTNTLNTVFNRLIYNVKDDWEKEIELHFYC